MIEGTLHAGKSIKWRNSLPSLSSRLRHKSQDVDMNAALFVKLSLLRFYRKWWNSTTVVSLLTQRPASREPVLRAAPTVGMLHGGTFLFYYTDSVSDLLAADTVTRVFVSTERPIG